MRHELKTWPWYFKAIWEGRKTFELRCTDDRTFYEGDELILREHDVIDGYTGRRIFCKVGFILPGGYFKLPKNFCIMSLLDIRQLGPDEFVIDSFITETADANL